MRTLYAWVAGQVEGASVSVAGARAITNKDGHAQLDTQVPAGAVNVQVDIVARGCKPYSATAALTAETRDISIGDTHQTSAGAVLLPALVPDVQALEPVHVQGRQFFYPDGRVYFAVGFSAFASFKQFLEGGAGAAAPFIDDCLALCREVRVPFEPVFRVFRAAAPPNVFAVDPRNYSPSALVEFAQWIAGKGGRVEFTAGDSAALGLDEAWRRNRLDQDFTALADAHVTNAFLQELNEPGDPRKNGRLSGWRPQSQDVICCSGDGDDQSRMANMFHYLDFHPVRDESPGPWAQYPRWLCDPFEVIPDGFAGCPAVPNPCVIGEGKGFDEIQDGDRRSPDPRKAFLYGLKIAGAFAGGYFHSGQGLPDPRGGIASLPFRLVTRECARMFLKGMIAPTLGLER